MTAPTTEPPALPGWSEDWRVVWRADRPVQIEGIETQIAVGIDQRGDPRAMLKPVPYSYWFEADSEQDVVWRAWALHERARADAERAARKAESYALALLLVPEADTKTCAEAALCARMTADGLRALGVEP